MCRFDLTRRRHGIIRKWGGGVERMNGLNRPDDGVWLSEMDAPACAVAGLLRAFESAPLSSPIRRRGQRERNGCIGRFRYLCVYLSRTSRILCSVSYFRLDLVISLVLNDAAHVWFDNWQLKAEERKSGRLRDVFVSSLQSGSSFLFIVSLCFFLSIFPSFFVSFYWPVGLRLSICLSFFLSFLASLLPSFSFHRRRRRRRRQLNRERETRTIVWIVANGEVEKRRGGRIAAALTALRQ